MTDHASSSWQNSSPVGQQPTPRILRDDLHTHLYGCIAAEEIWEIGRERWRQQEAKLEWYADEYAKAYGRRPDYASYWQTTSGLQRLKDDFEFREPAPFHCFQARFNLSIALLPIVPEKPEALDLALTSQRRAGTRYLELRCFVPHFADDVVNTYITRLAETCLRIDLESGGEFTPRLAFSLSRDNEILYRQYPLLRAILANRRDLARVVTGIDFCHIEEGYPPSDKSAFFQQVLADNARDPETALAILYHVGESFQQMSLMSAARWVYEAHRLGAHRLGHAIALGLDPRNLIGKTIQEKASERRAHLAWVLAEAPWLAARGYDVDPGNVRRELAHLTDLSDEAPVAISYDESLAQDCYALQSALIAAIGDEGGIIESCPSSNFRIGQIASARKHPLPRFVAQGLNVLVATDDPGIFAVDLASEESLCREAFGFDDLVLQNLQETAERARAGMLSGRSA